MSVYLVLTLYFVCICISLYSTWYTGGHKDKLMLRSESPCTRPVSWYPPVESFDRSSQFTAGVFMCGCKQTQMTKRKK